jgi:hypothetical protein
MPRRTTAANKVDITTDLVPPGAKQITRTTTERFTSPLEEEKQPLNLLDDDVPANEPEDNLDEPEDNLDEPKTALDSLLESLKGVGEIIIYVIRKPDPQGMTFANPTTMSHTVGDLPFDDSFTCKEAIELAVQRAYGGGKYQLQIRQNGNYVTAWSALIPDPRKRVEPNPPQPQYQPQPNHDVEPRRTAREELREILDVARDIANIRGSQASAPAATLPAQNPIDAAKDTINLVREVSELMGNNNAPTGGERNWVDSAATLVEKLGIGQLVQSVGSMIAQEAIRARREAAAQQTSNGNNAAGHTPSSPEQTALPASPGVSSGEAPTQTVPSAVATEATAPTATPEELRILGVVVTEMRGYDLDDNHDLLDERVARAAAALRELPQSELDQLLPVPNVFLLAYLVQVNPDWADLADMEDASRFIYALKESLQPEPAEQGTGDVVDFPPLAAVSDEPTEEPNANKEN